MKTIKPRARLGLSLVVSVLLAVSAFPAAALASPEGAQTTDTTTSEGQGSQGDSGAKSSDSDDVKNDGDDSESEKSESTQGDSADKGEDATPPASDGQTVGKQARRLAQVAEALGTFTATVNSSLSGGSLALRTSSEDSPSGSVSADAGTVVTVVVTPDSGKQLLAGSLKYVVGSTDTSISQTAGAYTFAMPESNVSVTAQFVDEVVAVTAGTLTQTIESATVPPGASVTARIGDTVIVKSTITANGAAYGFTAGFTYPSRTLEFLPGSWAADNPELSTLPVTSADANGNGIIRIEKESDGATPFFTAGEERIFTFRFKVTNMDGGSPTMSFGNNVQPTRISLFKDPTLRIADLKDPETGAYFGNSPYLALPISPEKLARTVIVNSGSAGTFSRLSTISGATLSFATIDTQEMKPGEKARVKLTINSDADAYGFAVAFQWTSAWLSLDTSTWATDNPGIAVPTVTDSGSFTDALLVQESNGNNVVVEADEPREIILTFKNLAARTGSQNISVRQNLFTPVLFTDPNVRAFGNGGLFADEDNTTWNAQITAAEYAGKVRLTNVPGAASILGGYHAAVEFSKETGIVGGNSEPVTVKATITGPTNKPVYGLSAGILYPGGHIALDQALTSAANPGLDLDFGDLTAPTSTSSSGTMQQIYVESNGSSVILAAGGTLELNLVFKPAMTGAGARNVSIATNINGNRMVLFTDRSVRAKETGEGLTTIAFTMENIQAAEVADKIVIAGPIAGSITTVRKYTDLALDANGYYALTSAADIQKFADAVASGDNTIKGSITTDVTLPDTFAGIGTTTHPFKGELRGNSSVRVVTVDRTVTSGNNPVVGGLVSYLGAGGLVSSLNVAGTISVSGTTGKAHIGGLVGKSDGGTVTQSTNRATITATGVDANVGGIAGTASATVGSAALFPYVTDTVTNTGTVSGGTNTGGIFGEYNGTSDPADASNTVYRARNSGQVSGGANVGGIIGTSNRGRVLESGNGVWVTNVWTNGGALSSSGAVGGVVGRAVAATVENGFNTGTIVGGSSAGGIVGIATGQSAIIDSWNGVLGLVSSGTAQAGIGGIVGEIGLGNVTVAVNTNLGNVVASAPQIVAGGITGKAGSIPARYARNYYVTGTASGDGLDSASLGAGNMKAGSTTTDRLLYSGASAQTPGKYSYLSDDPDQDAEGTYLLRSNDDLLWLANRVATNTADGSWNKVNVRLMADLDMTGEPFAGIGGQLMHTRYAGIFDGNGKTVKVDLKGTSIAAFFNYVGPGGVIRGLTITGSVTGTSMAAGIAGYVQGATIEDVHNEAVISSPNGSIVAGIAASVSESTISNSSNSGAVSKNESSTSGQAGGIVGSITGTSVIENTTNSAPVTGGNQVGGIAGSTYATGAPTQTSVTIRNVKNTGKITSNTPASSSITNTNAVGGLVGYASSGPNNGYDPETNTAFVGIIRILNSENTGTVTGTTNSLGGILGQASGSYSLELEVIGNTNSGDVISTYAGTDSFAVQYINVGGIVGSTRLPYMVPTIDGVRYDIYSGKVENNHNTGNVSAITGRNVSSIIGAHENSLENVADNSTTVLVGNDLDNPKIKLVSSPGENPDPKPTNPPVGPNDRTPTPKDPSTPGVPTAARQLTPEPTADSDEQAVDEETPTVTPPDVAEDEDEDEQLETADAIRETTQNNPLIVVLVIALLAAVAGGAGIWLSRRRSGNA